MLVPVLPVRDARCCFSMGTSQSPAKKYFLFQRNIPSVVSIGIPSSGSASPCAHLSGYSKAAVGESKCWELQKLGEEWEIRHRRNLGLGSAHGVSMVGEMLGWLLRCQWLVLDVELLDMDYPELEGTMESSSGLDRAARFIRRCRATSLRIQQTPERKTLSVVGLDLCFDPARASQFLF